MKTFKVILTRAYAIEVKAKNEDEAKHFAEFYLGNPPDLATEKEKKESKFQFGEIEMLMNEAHEAEAAK